MKYVNMYVVISYEDMEWNYKKIITLNIGKF